MSPATYQTVKLSKGKHISPDDGACVMELASMLAGEPFSDHPRCACPVIGSFLRAYNDSVDDDRRQDLYAYASRWSAAAPRPRCSAPAASGWPPGSSSCAAGAGRAACCPGACADRAAPALRAGRGRHPCRTRDRAPHRATTSRGLALIDELLGLDHPRRSEPPGAAPGRRHRPPCARSEPRPPRRPAGEPRARRGRRPAPAGHGRVPARAASRTGARARATGSRSPTRARARPLPVAVVLGLVPDGDRHPPLRPRPLPRRARVAARRGRTRTVSSATRSSGSARSPRTRQPVLQRPHAARSA